MHSAVSVELYSSIAPYTKRSRYAQYTLTTAKRGTILPRATVGFGGGGEGGGLASPQRRQAAGRLAFLTLIVVYEFHTREEGRKRLGIPGGRWISGSLHLRNQEQSPVSAAPAWGAATCYRAVIHSARVANQASCPERRCRSIHTCACVGHGLRTYQHRQLRLLAEKEMKLHAAHVHTQTGVIGFDRVLGLE